MDPVSPFWPFPYIGSSFTIAISVGSASSVLGCCVSLLGNEANSIGVGACTVSGATICCTGASGFAGASSPS